MSKKLAQVLVWVPGGEIPGIYLIVRPLQLGLKIKVYQSKMRNLYESKEILPKEALTFLYLEDFEKSSYCGLLLENPSGKEERIVTPLRVPPSLEGELDLAFKTSTLRGPLETIQRVTHEISNGYEGAMKKVIGQIVGFLAAL